MLCLFTFSENAQIFHYCIQVFHLTYTLKWLQPWKRRKEKLTDNDWHVARDRGETARKQVIVFSKCYQHQCHSEMYLLFVREPVETGKVSWISSLILGCARNLAVPVRRLNGFHEEIKKVKSQLLTQSWYLK